MTYDVSRFEEEVVADVMQLNSGGSLNALDGKASVLAGRYPDKAEEIARIVDDPELDKRPVDQSALQAAHLALDTLDVRI